MLFGDVIIVIIRFLYVIECGFYVSNMLYRNVIQLQKRCLTWEEVGGGVLTDCLVMGSSVGCL
jgi:hypothetical protein